MAQNSDEKMIVDEIKKIIVTKPDIEGMIVHNPTDLRIISQEEKRVVISIDNIRCAVFFEKEEKAEKEFQALQMGAKRGITPVVYGRRGTYVVMSTINAPTLAKYLENNKVTKELTKKLLSLLDDFKAIGFTRLDQSPDYIYLMSNGSLKVVNLHRHNKLPEKQFPQRMIRGMGKQVTEFLNYVKELDSSLYDNWTKNPKFAATVEKAKLAEN
ncbi:hypothetical protein [Bacillus sp. Marseille-P3661]|uniref:hypothetical protein n=1 Tax=Bacillus sp. Marseille-P3661 TaxID=1936234 RepID=UPI000C85CA4B|nr:hypothetical protein [Bacillus sp. Marseille-P3661]